VNTRALVLTALPVLLMTDAGSAPVPMRDLALRGAITPAVRSVEGVARATIGMPFGRVGINANVHMKYGCDAAFSGTVTYSRVVRFFAKLKGVDLVTQLDGQVKSDQALDCQSSVIDSLVGAVVVDTTLMSGWLKTGQDSLHFRGPAWSTGDSTYHSVLTIVRGKRKYEMKVNMYER
jgi:hypothetical protein